jgi:hypothetical protein
MPYWLVVCWLLAAVCCLLSVVRPCTCPSGARARSGPCRPCRSPCTGSSCTRGRSSPCRSPCTRPSGARGGSGPCRSPCTLLERWRCCCCIWVSSMGGVPKRPPLCFRRVGLGELSTEPSIEESFRSLF